MKERSMNDIVLAHVHGHGLEQSTGLDEFKFCCNLGYILAYKYAYMMGILLFNKSGQRLAAGKLFCLSSF